MHRHTVPVLVGTPGRVPDGGRPCLLTTPSGPAAPKVARDFVRAVLRGTPLRALLDTAVLLTSEAVTRSHLRTPPTEDILMRVLTTPRGVHISVHDSAPAPATESDHRLSLFTHLAGHWGTTPCEGPPRSGSLWFELHAGGGPDR
ncbi:ATP-binding protein [Streptomyces sp. NPDC048650]|uniref:ATP-binding protein n=1 Tax=unclassified Streptomyces TaxID=2593676 RepID=UPI0037235B26